MVSDYERILERNYREARANNDRQKEEVFHVVETRKMHIPISARSDNASSPRDIEEGEEEEEEDIEVIEPSDDLRFKRHVILPFNL